MLRRTLLSALPLLLVDPTSAWAKSRTSYGGRLRLTLPLDFERIDPHDLESLTAALIGPSLFEPLFGVTSEGKPYPALASELPHLVSGKLRFSLRPGLMFSDGRALGAPEVVESILRSQKSNEQARKLGNVAAIGKSHVSLSLRDPTLATRILASPQLAIVGPRFHPEAPLGCGALQARNSGTKLILLRNASAPRGGSFVDGAELASGTLRECLRAFEARDSEIGFLGAGLYETRKGAQAFRLAPTGLLLLRPGKNLASFARPGVLNEALSRLAQAPLEALGIKRTSKPASRWSGPPMKILVNQNEPWIGSVASEIASAWSSPNVAVSAQPVSSSDLKRQLTSGIFDSALTFIRTEGKTEREIADTLFSLDRKSPPRSGRTMSPFEVGRQLELGVVGYLEPRGYLAPGWSALTTESAFDLANGRRQRS